MIFGKSSEAKYLTIMKRKTYQTTINAPREKVWAALWGEDTFPKWTAPFSPGSRAVTTWEEGGKILFLNGENEGMVSRVDKKRDNEFMDIRHLGIVDKDGNEDYESEKVKPWADAHEIYTLIPAGDGKTELTVDMDVDEEYEQYMDNTWPKAFSELRSVAEN
ncbi:Uncharacterized conserved protein YndB, AHSA1/START domain [Salinimicrobium catena]|uniref:Uncharacterized conserved protein YndB, AHSA1/START domain n=2 Tax=Salinimicrobium catena TaxID=390640 RepID=A0A1H5N3H7_9FLAO|nr:Uncharacterized conserved protein YndB, AHSA1/START domain [Salinimicrobium catena]SEE96010.1 Uncharacterized conserved protein YndB, AHSA1/START domain [Salinimicrobium catena]